MYSSYEILEKALQKEQQSFEFYSNLTDTCTNEPLKKLLEKLRDEESRHIHMVEKMLIHLKLGHTPVWPMHIKFIIFLGTMLIFIFGMHFAFFRSLVSFFSISNPVLKTILYIAMILLTFSFISSFFLLHWRENSWTIGYYKLAATWMGFLINFVCVC